MQKTTVCYSPGREAAGQTGASTVASPPCREDSPSIEIEDLHEYFSMWRGVRYRYGGLTTKGVDCSGLTLRAYNELYGITLPRTVVQQSKRGMKVKKNSLRPGDLVFFKISRFSRHVGIYLGDNTFIHASRSKGVMLSDLDNVYWSKRYWQAKRFEPGNS